jgi:exonuclease VII large subunit
LARGYAIVTGADGRPVLDAETLCANDPVDIALARGRAAATIAAVFTDEKR